MSETFIDVSIHTGDHIPSRRGFLRKLLAVLTGAVAGIVPLATGLFAVSSPVFRRRAGKGEEPFLRVASLESVPPDGVPRAFHVITDKQDAWTRTVAVPIGAVHIVRRAEKPDEVLAFNTVCPHLGCYVDPRPDGSFLCPCHNSHFKADGSRGDPCVAPRGLDPIETKVEGDEVLVRFQNFQTGIAERVPV